MPNQKKVPLLVLQRRKCSTRLKVTVIAFSIRMSCNAVVVIVKTCGNRLSCRRAICICRQVSFFFCDLSVGFTSFFSVHISKFNPFYKQAFTSNGSFYLTAAIKNLTLEPFQLMHISVTNSCEVQPHEKTVSILGCGWFGFALAKALIKDGFQVYGSTTTPEKAERLETEGIKPFVILSTREGISESGDFFDASVLIIAIPPGRKPESTAQYPEKISSIRDAALNGLVRKLIFISSTSVYGDLNVEFSEKDPPSPETASGQSMVKAENILQQSPLQTTVIRFAGLVGPGRDPGRFFAGKTNIPNGRAPVNLIHLDDCIGLTQAVISNGLFGHIFNAVAPHHPSKQEFYTQATNNSRLSPAHFIDELSVWKKVATNRIPDPLPYNFKVADWNDWLSAGKL